MRQKIPSMETLEQEFHEEAVEKEPDTEDSADNTENEVQTENDLSHETVDKLSEVFKNRWEKLALKLGYTMVM